MTNLAYRLDRTVTIRATPATVFRFFTDSARWAAWWGAGSTIEPRPGGAVHIVLPGNVVAGGEVVEIDAPRRLVFTHGFASGKPFPQGGSRVTVTLEAIRAGTRLTLLHELPDDAARNEHVQGWRYQLSVFANVVADEVARGAAEAVDAWLAAWGEQDVERRTATLNRIAEPSITFRDRYSNLEGIPDIVAHVTAALYFMPNVKLKRTGDVRHTQGTAVADWEVAGPDGSVAMAGCNVFNFGPSGLLESVVGVVAGNKAVSGSRG